MKHTPIEKPSAEPMEEVVIDDDGTYLIYLLEIN